METLNSLDSEQQKAAGELQRNVLVLAGPGSGKTLLLVHRVNYLLERERTGAARVLCLTFSVEAAKEMRRRLDNLVNRANRQRLAVMNFHQFCLNLLRHYGHLVNVDREFTVLGEVDRIELLEEVAASSSYGNIRPDSLVEFISTRKGRREYRGNLLREIEAASLESIVAEYERQKLERSELDFDDLILKAVELLETRQRVRESVTTTFPHLAVDELQDTSLMQLTLLQLLYAESASRILAVADDDQMVYEWRDARPETLREFEDYFNPEIMMLRRNYRCPSRVVNVANALISHNEDRREKGLIAMREDTEGRVTLSEWQSLEQQAGFIADTIVEHATNDRPYSDNAVLVRQRQSMVMVRAALEDSEVPFVEIGGRDVERSPFVRVLLGALRLAAGEEHGAVLVQRACRRANEALGSDILAHADVRRFSAQYAGSFTSAFVAILAAELNIAEILDQYGEAVEAMAVERLIAMVELARSESDWRDYASMVRTLSVEFQSLLSRVNMNYNAVRLMTIHSAKGLQFGCVFIPDLSDGAFPNLRSRRTPNVAEERRVLFVATTRSQEEVHFSWSNEGLWGYPVEASLFVDELLRADDECVERLTATPVP